MVQSKFAKHPKIVLVEPNCIEFHQQIYKIPDGKPENEFAFNGEAKNATFATEIVNETHRFWQSLIKKEVESDKISW